MPPAYPNFFLIGAARSGTTALYQALSAHPEVFTSPVKEPWFFAFDRPPPGGASLQVPANGGIWRRELYEELFASWSGQPAIGEASTVYLHSPYAARRIARELPEAKLIVVLRHPIARAYSHYLLNVRSRLESARSFEQALAREEPITPANWYRFDFYRGGGLYHQHLSVYFDLFPPEQIRVFLYDDWRGQPQQVLSDVFGFLNVDPRFTVTPQELNPAKALRSRLANRLGRRNALPRSLRMFVRRHNVRPIPPMRRETRRQLLNAYREDVVGLEALIGRDLSHWLEDEEITLAASARP